MTLSVRILSSCALLLAAAACKPELDEIQPEAGSANFSRYVAIGDSYTANVTNGGLYSEGQQQSYAAIIARQLELVGGKVGFDQPLMAGNGTGYLQLLGLDANGNPVTQPVPATEIGNPAGFTALCPSTEPLYYLTRAAAIPAEGFQNLGIPGLRVTAITEQNYGNQTNPLNTNTARLNPYFERTLQPGDASSYLSVIRKSNPTFFTCWIGIDEILEYALSGGTCTAPLSVMPADPPAANSYTVKVRMLLDSLEENGAKGIVANIPYVYDFPYFLRVDNSKLIAKAKETPGVTDIFIKRSNGQTDALKFNDIVLEKAVARIGQPDVNGNPYGYSAASALESGDVLDYTEVAKILTATNSYNNALNTRILSSTNKHPLLDMRSFMQQIANPGQLINGTFYSRDLTKGEMFSLDGLHFSARGNAVIANLFIDLINKGGDIYTKHKGYGSSIPQVNPNDFPATIRP
jgi:hypothetical protein